MSIEDRLTASGGSDTSGASSREQRHLYRKGSGRVKGRAHVMIGAALSTGEYCSKYWSLQFQALQQRPGMFTCRCSGKQQLVTGREFCKGNGRGAYHCETEPLQQAHKRMLDFRSYTESKRLPLRLHSGDRACHKLMQTRLPTQKRHALCMADRARLASETRTEVQSDLAPCPQTKSDSQMQSTLGVARTGRRRCRPRGRAASASRWSAPPSGAPPAAPTPAAPPVE